jgi:hypothetical protein
VSPHRDTTTHPALEPNLASSNLSFLGYVDLQGTTYQSPTLATGFASHFAQPLLREAYEQRMEQGKRGEKEGELLSRQEAEAVLDNCMKVLFYRDARSLNKVSSKTNRELRGSKRKAETGRRIARLFNSSSTKSLRSQTTGSISRLARRTRLNGNSPKVFEGTDLRSSSRCKGGVDHVSRLRFIGMKCL